MQFSHFTWQKRWNNAASHTAGITQGDGSYTLVTCQGTIRFDEEDAPYILESLTNAAELMRQTFVATNAEMAARELMRQNKKMQAIKTYRLIMSDVGILVGLKEAKDFVEGLKL
jgi:hypothetical protein